MIRSIKTIAIVFFILTGLITVTHAAWRCRIHSGSEGRSWYSTAPTRPLAVASAMARCAHHSSVETQCVIDFCHQYDNRSNTRVKIFENPRFARGGPWHCEVENSSGIRFIGSAGTRAVAVGRASGLCSANTIYPRYCIVKGCFVK